MASIEGKKIGLIERNNGEWRVESGGTFQASITVDGANRVRFMLGLCLDYPAQGLSLELSSVVSGHILNSCGTRF